MKSSQIQLFNKGLTLRFLGRNKEAYDAIFKACWNAAWQDAGYFNLAQLDCIKKDQTKALELIDKSLIRNWHNHKARHLKTVILRKNENKAKALQLIEDSLQIDQFNFGVLFEKYKWTQEEKDIEHLKNMMRGNVHNYIEFSLDYAQAGFYEEAQEFLELYFQQSKQPYPMAGYFMGWYSEKMDQKEQAAKWDSKAQKMNTD